MNRTVDTKISLRMQPALHDGLGTLARKEGYALSGYITRILAKHLVDHGPVEDPEIERLGTETWLCQRAVQKAREVLDAEGFDQHFTLTVIDHLFRDREFRERYETYVGGTAEEKGLPRKSPINMYLGWYIKNAVAAEPVLDSAGKPKRAQVKGKPIQSYTLLRLAREHPRI